MRVAASWRVGALITRLVLSNRLAPTRGTTAGGVAMVLLPARKVVMVPGVAVGGARTARRRASRDIFLSTTSLQKLKKRSFVALCNITNTMNLMQPFCRSKIEGRMCCYLFAMFQCLWRNKVHHICTQQFDLSSFDVQLAPLVKCFLKSRTVALSLSLLR